MTNEQEQIFNVVLGTAGHIDHGKSSLVQALTGIHPDRLKEEQDRGITIDLGFAPLQLSNGMRVGIIDVPGHERFIKNMVAGASGIDFVMLVVAADDGVMAQTREHLQIVQLLAVRDGLTVVTKKDLVEPEYLELAVDDARQLVAGTMLEGKPVLAVSSKTGEGIAELKAQLDRSLSKLGRRGSGGPFRMPIQRVFAKEGFGTVLTGVPLSGQVAIGDVLEVLPPGYSGRVKGLHAYKSAIARGQAGHSTAVNLHGPEIDKKEIVRGMVVATPGVFRPTKLLTARLTHLPGSPWPLKHRAPVRFHAGTAEIQGKVLLLDGERMTPGTAGWVQILLEEPTLAAPGDHFILRHQTPMVTLGGGRIVDVVPRKRKRALFTKEGAENAEEQLVESLPSANKAQIDQPNASSSKNQFSATSAPSAVNEDLQRRLDSLDRPADFLAHVLAAAEAPKTVADLCAEAGLLPAQVLAILNQLAAGKRAVALKPEALYIAPGLLDELSRAVVACIQEFFQEHPALGSVELPELRRRLEKKTGAERAACFDDLLALLKQRNVVKAESNFVALPDRQRKLEGALAEAAKQVEAAFEAGGLAPPAPAEVAARLNLPPKTEREIYKYLTETDILVEATKEVLFHRRAFDGALAEVRKLFAQKPEQTTSEIRQHLGMNRKYVVPLVELFDRQGLTVRVGDKRRLK